MYMFMNIQSIMVQKQQIVVLVSATAPDGLAPDAHAAVAGWHMLTLAPLVLHEFKLAIEQKSII